MMDERLRVRLQKHRHLLMQQIHIAELCGRKVTAKDLQKFLSLLQQLKKLFERR